MKSSFKFQSYKIDEFSLETANDLAVLSTKDPLRTEDWEFALDFRQPQYFEEHKIYVGGLDLKMRVLGEAQGQESEEQPSARIFVRAGIAGIFQCEGKEFSAEVEQRLVKFQIPAILLPYLRSAVMSFLANAGFGSVVLPLLNIQEMAKSCMEDVEILKH